MLLSPGHSPRQLSSPSPSETPNPTTTTTPSTTRKRSAAVLDEDTYVAAVERIIERDFFPDIPKLRDRLHWLQALRSQDPLLIRDAQLQIQNRRQSHHATASRRSVTPFTPTPFGPATPFNPPVEPSDDPLASVDTSGTLDDFFKRYTSEDNASFSKIIEKVNRKKREKYAHLLEGEKSGTQLLEDKNRDRITDGYGTSGQPVSTLDSWNYTAKNLLMYYPADNGEVALTEAEREARLKASTKEINRSNTRFHGKSSVEGNSAKEEESVAILYAPVSGATPSGAAWPFADREAEKTRKYDLEDLRKTPNPFFVESSKKAENGYSFVKTPSPAPGVDESPFMTWGEIEGTPLRLDMEEGVGIGGSSDGPHFSIPLPPSRDVKAHSLAREAARNLKEKSRMFKKPPLPSPARGGSASPSVRTFSPAAQRFVRSAIAKSSRSVDETLRASYRGGLSPLVGTPKEKTRFSRDGSLGSRSPSARHGSATPW